jgi:hypothetical protein
MPKDTAENRLKESIKLGLAKGFWPGLKLFSNPRGTARGPRSDDRYICYGLAPGSKTLASSDFIGWRTIEITSNMVGHKIAQFASIETKAPGQKATQEQRAWLELVKRAGGLADTVNCPEQLDDLLEAGTVLMNIPIDSD